MRSGKLFQPQYIVARLGGQVVELTRFGDVLPPAGQLLVNGLGAGDIAWVIGISSTRLPSTV